MHSIPYRSVPQMIARLMSTHRHCEKRPRSKEEARATKRRLREFQNEMAQVTWGCTHTGVEL